MYRLLTLCLLISAQPAWSQDAKDIFADPQNLKVLPEDIPSNELRGIMRGFAMALGARCETCHVGEAGMPLEEFDFAADEKETKETARAMLKMVRAINTDHIRPLDGERMDVTCVTCHRGVLQPKLTWMVLQDSMDEEGIEAVDKKYRELRENYYGTHSYDFSESVLSDMAQQLARGGDPGSAMKLLTLNDEFFPDSFRNHWLKGEVAMMAQDNGEARRNFEKALEIGADPRSEAFIKQRLSSLPSD